MWPEQHPRGSRGRAPIRKRLRPLKLEQKKGAQGGNHVLQVQQTTLHAVPCLRPDLGCCCGDVPIMAMTPSCCHACRLELLEARVKGKAKAIQAAARQIPMCVSVAYVASAGSIRMAHWHCGARHGACPCPCDYARNSSAGNFLCFRCHPTY